MKKLLLAAFALVLTGYGLRAQDGKVAPAGGAAVVDASTIRKKVLCGYQAWFRCPGDAMGRGWVHWSRDGRKITPETVTFEMWPDMTEYPPEERYAATGFTHADGSQTYLFSSDNLGTIRRHFGWMKQYGIDGVFLQHFAVDLPPAKDRYESRTRVLGHVRAAAKETGRAWAIAFDLAGMRTDRMVEAVTTEWKKLINEGVPKDAQYIKEKGLPVVQIWGFFSGDSNNRMTAAVANELIDFFKADGPYRAFLIGGGDWFWRKNKDPEWQAFVRRFDGYSPWNIGNYSKDAQGATHATTNYWADDKAEFEKLGKLWLPTTYPGFGWDNLKQKQDGQSGIERRKGEFLWEQFHALSKLNVDTFIVSMFDEVDEGTAIFKVTNSPPTQGKFKTFEGMPADWYLRLVGEGARLLKTGQPVPRGIPLKP